MIRKEKKKKLSILGPTLQEFIESKAKGNEQWEAFKKGITQNYLHQLRYRAREKKEEILEVLQLLLQTEFLTKDEILSLFSPKEEKMRQQRRRPSQGKQKESMELQEIKASRETGEEKAHESEDATPNLDDAIDDIVVVS